MLNAIEIKRIRKKANLTQLEMSKLFNYASVRTWQKKEETGASASSLSFAEEEYFLLLTNEHPTKKLIDK